VRRLAIVVLVGVLLAACGGGSKHSTPGPPSAQAQIKSAYVKFFAGSTPLSERVSLLENGQQFKPVIKLFADNPLAKNASATVSSVTLQGANKAKVAFNVKVGGAALGTQTGTAVRQNGTWKVGDAGLCKLVALGGTTPPACKP
jgi:hypothetical protein